MNTLATQVRVIDWAEEAVRKYPPPFVPHDFQMDVIREHAVYDRTGFYAEVGCGKTFMGTYIALIWDMKEGVDTIIVTMPPILLAGWKRWLDQIVDPESVLIYRGTPKERAAMDLRKPKWLLMTMQIFKGDNERLEKDLAGRKLVGIIDEATCIKNSASDNYRYTRQFFGVHKLVLMTGTPLSGPGDAFAYVKLIAPNVYRSYGQFQNIHVEEKDFFGTVIKWQNLELMQKNLLINSVRIIKEDVLKHLKQPVYVPIYYDLDKKHKKLYDQLAEEQLLLLEDGGKIDATSAPRLYNALQQIILNFDHFSGVPNAVSAGYDLVQTTMEEIDKDRKLIIFANYRMTNRNLLRQLESYNAVACYSEVSAKQQEKNVDKFLNDPECRIMIAQPISAGAGWNPQYVCSDELFLETPIVPKDFHQAVGRVAREGQEKVPVVRIAIAKGTIQERLFNNLLVNDSVVNKVQRSYQDLRDAIYGK